MAREIHYDRTKVDLKLSVQQPGEVVMEALKASILDGKNVEVAGVAANHITVTVRSIARRDIGTFVVRWESHPTEQQTTVVTSSLVQSVLLKSSYIPFVFGKGTPMALPGYEKAMERCRAAFK